MFEPETIKVDNPNGVGELPRDFMVVRSGSRWTRYENYGTGWNKYVWNYEWVWSDDVGEQTAIDAWMKSEQAAVLMIVNDFGNRGECGRSHGRDEAHQEKCELCSAGMPCDPSCQNEAG
jgi:hypothetical protein